MERTEMAGENLIIEAQPGDRERAHDILSEICQVLKKHNCVLMRGEHGMVLAPIIDVFGMKCRAIAHVKTLTPATMEWAVIDWKPKKPQ
jgi:hypothetical protein